MGCTSCRLTIVLAISWIALLAAPTLGADFSIVLMPDTQYYTTEDDLFPKCSWRDGLDIYYVPEIYQRQAQWIVDWRHTFNIQRVIHLGDVTNGADSGMWSVAREAHDILYDAGIPFSVIPGNHDYDGDTLSGRSLSSYNAAFGPGSSYGTWYDGQTGSGAENTYVEFQQEGLDFLLVNLEYRPRKSTICWANEVISSHPGHRVIIATHGYQGHDGVHASTSTSVLGADGWNLWDELIRRHSNIFLVVSGHINDSEHVTRTGLAGNVIHEVLTDYQYEGPAGHEDAFASDGKGRCGNGWLKLLRFYPSGNRIDVVTRTSERYNTAVFPHAAYSAEFFTDDYCRDPATDDHVLSLDYDMTAAPAPYVFTEGHRHFGNTVVNTVDDGDQRDPQVATDANGNMVVVWQDDRDENGYYEIYMRGLSAGGCELFSERNVNTTSSGQQRDPAVAMDDAGNFVVVWEDDLDNNGSYDIRARGFDAAGDERWPDRDLNAVASGQQLDPFLAMHANGDFVVVWEDDSDGNGYYDIRVRGFHANGTERFSQRTAHDETSGQQNDPVVAMADDGHFVVVWRHDPDKNGSYDIWAHGFAADGSGLSDDFRVNSYTSGQQNDPAIAMEPNGDLIVVWEDDYDGNDTYDIWGRWYLVDGTTIRNMKVNTVTSGEQRNPGVGVNSQGDWVIVWQDDSDGNGSYDIKAVGMYNDGSPWIDEMRINTATSGQQQLPEVIVDDSGCFVAVWKDDVDGNGLWEIAARGIAAYDVTTAVAGGGNAFGGATQAVSGSFVQVSAEASPGYEFVGWTGGAEDPRALTTDVFVDSDKIVTAHFEPIANTLAHGLTAYWSFDEDFSATAGGSDFDGTPVGLGGALPTSVPGGRFGNGARFVRADGQCVVIDTPVITPGTDHSFSAWYRTTWTTIGNFDDRYFVLETTGASGAAAYSASYGLRDVEGDGLDTQGQIYTIWSFDTANALFDQSVGEDQWHNVVVNYDASKALHTVYYDGVAVKTMDSWSELEATTGLVIGGHRDRQRNWDGMIDDVAFWDRPLTTEEIATLQTSSVLEEITGVDPGAEGTVLQYSLSAAGPNPFVARTTFRFGLPTPGPVRVEVYDVRGRRVKTLIKEELPRGRHLVDWAGRDDAGQSVANGVYFVRMQAGPFRQTLKLALVR